jgi:hypothetical protein
MPLLRFDAVVGCFTGAPWRAPGMPAAEAAAPRSAARLLGAGSSSRRERDESSATDWRSCEAALPKTLLLCPALPTAEPASFQDAAAVSALRDGEPQSLAFLLRLLHPVLQSPKQAAHRASRKRVADRPSSAPTALSPSTTPCAQLPAGPRPKQTLWQTMSLHWLMIMPHPHKLRRAHGRSAQQHRSAAKRDPKAAATMVPTPRAPLDGPLPRGRLGGSRRLRAVPNTPTSEAWPGLTRAAGVAAA